MKDRFAAGLALGLAVALGISLTSGPRGTAFADATSPSGNNEYLALTASGVATGEHNIVIVDSATKRLMLYNLKPGTAELTLVAVRNLTFDAKYEQFGQQKPTVTEVHDAVIKKP